jgi:hypothetical protein
MADTKETLCTVTPKADEDRLLRAREVQQANEGWPWISAPSRLLTQAPFALNEYNRAAGHFKMEEMMQVWEHVLTSGNMLTY